MSHATERPAFPNRIRMEVERMPWPEVLNDDLGDARWEAARWRRAAMFWCTAALFLAAVLVALVLIEFVVS
jgi:hypothetical protein